MRSAILFAALVVADAITMIHGKAPSDRVAKFIGIVLLVFLVWDIWESIFK